MGNSHAIFGKISSLNASNLNFLYRSVLFAAGLHISYLSMRVKHLNQQSTLQNDTDTMHCTPQKSNTQKRTCLMSDA